MHCLSGDVFWNDFGVISGVVDNGAGEPDHRPVKLFADRTIARSPTLGLTAISLGFLMITSDATIADVALGAIGTGAMAFLSGRLVSHVGEWTAIVFGGILSSRSGP
jgi:hypothetical protein